MSYRSIALSESLVVTESNSGHPTVNFDSVSGCLCLIHMLLILSSFVDGSPVVTTPAPATTAELKAQNTPIHDGTTPPNQMEHDTTQRSSFDTQKTPDTPNTNGPQTMTTNERQAPNAVTMQNPKPTDQMLSMQTSGVSAPASHTTESSKTRSNRPSSAQKGGNMMGMPSMTQRNRSPIRLTKIYQVKSQKGCPSKKEHDIKVHIGEGKYVNIKISEE